MKVFENIDQWVAFRNEMLQHGQSLGFVPTMGALHAGHLALVKKAQAEQDHSLVSIFVNPTQFNSVEDLEKYPRDLDRDLERLDKINADYVLVPSVDQIYSDNKRFVVSETKESQILCGAFRSGHFEGVLTVMMKLLGLARADACYMGEKDFQQLHLIQQLAEHFFLKTRIVGCPTVRELSGLAMSSRNERLSLEGRIKAAQIFHSLSNSQSAAAASAELNSTGFKVEYCEEHWGRRLIAAWHEGVRLIDNVALDRAKH